jgi:cell division septum initiation protein DivIVA
VAALGLAGCQLCAVAPEDSLPPQVAEPVEDAAAHLPSIEDLLDLQARLSEADPPTQKAITQNLDRLLQQEDNAYNRLRLALALSVPFYSPGDMDRARKLIGELRSASPPLPQAYDVILRLRLANLDDVDRYLERLATFREENQGLRKELDDAQAKFRALSDIEQKIERPSSVVAPP